MQLLNPLRKSRNHYTDFDVTIFQTPYFGDSKGYEVVYRLKIAGKGHDEILEEVFTKFNIRDRMPKDYCARYVSTGDIVFIDEGRNGHHYYQLKSGGWRPVQRFHIR